MPVSQRILEVEPWVDETLGVHVHIKNVGDGNTQRVACLGVLHDRAERMLNDPVSDGFVSDLVASTCDVSVGEGGGARGFVPCSDNGRSRRLEESGVGKQLGGCERRWVRRDGA